MLYLFVFQCLQGIRSEGYSIPVIQTFDFGLSYIRALYSASQSKHVNNCASGMILLS